MRRQLLATMAMALSLAGGEALAAIQARDSPPPTLIIDLPEGPGPYPVAIYAPGGGGNANAAFPSALTRSLLRRGIAVVRFDWSFRPVPGSTQAKDLVSPDMALEAADYTAVLTNVTSDQRFLGGSILLMGKSLGSIVAAKVLSAEPKPAGAVLMTPVCSRVGKPLDPAWLRDPYPSLMVETRPIALISGETDPLCEPKALYALAARMRSPVRVSVVDGDHGFQVGEAPAANARNLELVAETSAAAAAAILRERR